MSPFASHHAAFAAGTSSPREVLETYLARIDAREPDVQAFAALDADAARRAADASTARHRAGTTLSAIDGMPIALKDILETADLPTGFGSPIFAGHRGGRDSAAAYALRRAGAVIVGKAVTTEFADTFPGPTRNPHDLARTAGGSSSGSAAAVAAGMVPVAIGSQVGGSILRPASFCGVIGFKPTFGALNRGGISDQFSQNCLGTLSATLEDGWAVCHAIASLAGGDPGFPPFSGGPTPAPPRRPVCLAALQTAGWAVADPSALAAFEAFLPRLSAAGIDLIDRTTSSRVAMLESAIAEAGPVSQQINNWEKLWPLAELDTRHGEQISSMLREGIAAGRAMTPDDYRILLHRRDEMRRLLVALTDSVDACITLAAPGPAPLGLASTGNAIFNQPASALRTPAIALPLLQAEGMPLGVQLIGYPDRDRDLSALANWMRDFAG
jgi:Asp-tRNA(Asn)/Glu-tRNA(Gln) amidotransferase A subunit family amidase